MEHYTLLLVDDEEEVIQVIMRKIDWEGLGFQVIGHANNGIKALELIEEYQPDVVMTDIRMPYMDGMELCSQIRAQYPATKTLIFTGFDEFEYAKEAVHLEIEEYILKPLNAVELSQVFSHLKSKLDQEFSEKRNTEILQKYYLDSLPLLQANFYTTLIEGRIHEEELDRYLSDYQITFSGPYYCCLVIHPSSSQVPQGMNPQLLALSVNRQAKEHLEKQCRGRCFSYLGNTILLAQLDSENQVTDLTDECDRFCKYVQRMVGAVVTVGIGHVCRTLPELSQSYAGAREAVSYRVLYGSGRSISIKEIAPGEVSGTEMSDDAERMQLFKMIRLGSHEEIEEAVDAYLNHIFLTGQSLQTHHVAIMEMLSQLYRFSANNEISIPDFSQEMGSLYERLISLEPKVLKKWLFEVCIAFHEEIVNVRYNSTRSLISQAKEYVQNHYQSEDLSLDSICEVLGVSNSYFSTTFKKETGNSFVGYVTDYRMEKASRRLIETSEKSYIIAKSVGYADPNYFSYVFKRKYGVSPSKYRTEYAKGEK